MQQQRRQTKRTSECGTGGVLETVKALLPKTSRAPGCAKKRAAPAIEPEQTTGGAATGGTADGSGEGSASPVVRL